MDSDITIQELEAAIHLSTKRSAPGPDGVSYKAIVSLGPTSRTLLLNLINDSWRRGFVPPSWKTSQVVPVLKPGKSPRELTSFRPISLTSCVCKIMERIILRRIEWFLEFRRLLPTEMAGFRKARTSIDCIINLVTHIEEARFRGTKAVMNLVVLFIAFTVLRSVSCDRGGFPESSELGKETNHSASDAKDTLDQDGHQSTASCLNGSIHYFAEPDSDCRKYSLCVPNVNGTVQTYTFLCPMPTVFDDQLNLCVLPSQSFVCERSLQFASANQSFTIESSLESMTAVPTLATTQLHDAGNDSESDIKARSGHESQLLPSEDGQVLSRLTSLCDGKNVTYIPDTFSSCKQYYMCVRVTEEKRRVHVFSCPNDKRFDVNHFKCVKPEHAPACGNSTAVSSTKYHELPSHSKFYQDVSRIFLNHVNMVSEWADQPPRPAPSSYGLPVLRILRKYVDNPNNSSKNVTFLKYATGLYTRYGNLLETSLINNGQQVISSTVKGISKGWGHLNTLSKTISQAAPVASLTLVLSKVSHAALPGQAQTEHHHKKHWKIQGKNSTFVGEKQPNPALTGMQLQPTASGKQPQLHHKALTGTHKPSLVHSPALSSHMKTQLSSKVQVTEHSTQPKAVLPAKTGVKQAHYPQNGHQETVVKQSFSLGAHQSDYNTFYSYLFKQLGFNAMPSAPVHGYTTYPNIDVQYWKVGPEFPPYVQGYYMNGH
ncbi:uncharacterized protein LOC135371719 [Ornithodoros turicata]|uniref:uncharacterized protein LOC135371719 n=1 Tax=Ornithodoros turicata TaxID=34597 RepID=UPI0031394464